MLAKICRKSLVGLCRALILAFRTGTRRPRVTLLALAIATAVLMGGLHKLNFLFSAEDMVGEGIQSADELASIKERYNEGVSTFLYLVPPAGKFTYSVDELCKIRLWYSIFRVSHPEMRAVVSSFDLKKMVQLSNGAWKYANLLQLDCNERSTDKDLQNLNREFNQSPWLGFHEKEERLSLSFSFTYDDSEPSKFGSFNPNVVKDIRESVEKDLLPLIPGSQVHWVGSADYQWYILQGYRFSVIVNLSMLVLLIIALRLFYGTWSAGIIFSITLIFNGIWTYGLKAWTGSPYDLLTNGLFIAIAISALEDFTFISAEQVKGSTWRASIRKMAIPSFFTSLTTVFGFLSLLVSNLAMIRRFGLWCALGAIQEWVMIFIFLPALLMVFYKKDRWVTRNPTRLEKISESALEKRLPKFLVIASLVVFPLSILLFGKVTANDTPAGAFTKSHPYPASLDELNRAKGWQATTSLLTNHKIDEAKFESIVKKIENLPEMTNIVAGAETSTRAIDWLSNGIPLSRDQVEMDFKTTDSYKSLVDSNDIPRAILYLKETSVVGLQHLEQAVALICPNHECHVGGSLIAYSDFATEIPKTLFSSMAVSLLLVGSVIAYVALALGQKRLIPDLLLSSFWGPCTMLIAVASLGIQMNFMNCVFAGVLVGLTGDNAIQYLFGARRGKLENGIRKRGSASFQTTVIMVIVSMAYLLSYFSPPKLFGMILASGLTVALIGDLWLLNEFIRRHRDE